jgi:hypothetical protein
MCEKSFKKCLHVSNRKSAQFLMEAQFFMAAQFFWWVL